MTDTKSIGRTLPLIISFAKSVAMLLAIGLLVSSCSDSNNEANTTGDNGTVALAQKLDGSIGGDVAAFLLSERKQSLLEVSFKDADGNTKTFADFAGKTVFINLWATWCAPCRAEMPSIERLSNKMASEEFAVVAISVDSGDDAKPKAFYQEIGLTDLPFYHDGTIGAFNTFKKKSLALGLPATVILDKKGGVLGKLNGPAEWDSPDALKLISAAIALD